MHAPSVLVVGAGFGGIAAAIELRAHGIRDVTIVDAAPDIGGTWLHNTYPGAACDVPSHLYSYSFAQRTDWTRLCSPQPEILAYLHDVAKEYGVADLVETNARIVSADRPRADGPWTATAEDGRSWTADVLIVATGQLNRPIVPDIPGTETFAGHTFHSARWDHEHDLRGRRVAVVGTGASAVQFVPAIAPEVGHMSVFQRSGNWFLPRRNREFPRWWRTAIEHVPGLQRWRRRFITEYCESLTLMIRHPATWGRVGRLYSTLFMRMQLRDPEVRRKAWPDYTFGCKRILFSSQWLPALQRDNVTLETERVTEIVPEGVRTADGRTHEVDTIIWGTGFAATDFMFPMEITGPGGRSLEDSWSDGAHAYLGMTVPGFPSMFVLYGPNTNTSGGSIIRYLENQVRYVRETLQEARRRGTSGVEVREDVERAYDEDLQARFPGTAWTRCDSWYRDSSGRIVTNWPGYMRDYEERTRRVDPADYVFH
ncbi:Predicted flavoprotein CzcO associated with the cation diffusion facilitator CzcD [Pseudonocardia ammonioxydans]|uniref:Predicted flavoprotein CzcO associated with the cation diffusion facilitator CzcD n=1 Tax=Pseudonocardia ammonioxydans TaxID=260086 RepID=A0A1I5GSH1_PSUAM|nr:NAD(P)/FAD-dependent oxidoreductase [Pseudonocardia ammonioxydans]SFO38889.1 Predicted flavoprotein CzcO associated with the cation diffusion facilitator CzcD [Pseudonocardia ammonioxydans]